MKEKFKKLLKMFAICCMALVSCFSIFACGETPDDPETEQGSGQTTPEGITGTPVTETTAVDKFNQLKTARDAMTPNNGYTYTDESTSKMQVTPNWDAFERNKVAKISSIPYSLADETNFNAFKNTIGENLSTMNDEYTSKEVTSYNSTTKNGYWLDESSNYSEYEISDIENNTLYYYSKWGNDEADQHKYKYNIDQNYYNQFIFDFYDNMEYSVGEVLKDTLEETESYLRNGFEAMGLTFGENDLGFTFEEKDGLSTLVIYANVTDKTMNIYGESLTGADFTMSLVFKFNSTMITELSAVMDLDATMSMAVAQDADGNDVNLSVAFAMDNTEKFTFSNTYDTEHAPSYTASEFKGTDGGEWDGDISDYVEIVANNSSDVYLHIGDYSFGYGYAFRMGEALDFSNYLGYGYSNVFTGNGLNDITWYTDKACTQAFTGNMPSYDINLYAKYDDVLAKLGTNYVFVCNMYTSNYVDGVDYEVYSTPRIGVTEKTGTVDAERYTCAYVNGTKVNAGDTYTLNSGLNKIIFVYSPEYY